MIIHLGIWDALHLVVYAMACSQEAQRERACAYKAEDPAVDADVMVSPVPHQQHGSTVNDDAMVEAGNYADAQTMSPTASTDAVLACIESGIPLYPMWVMRSKNLLEMSSSILDFVGTRVGESAFLRKRKRLPSMRCRVSFAATVYGTSAYRGICWA